MRSSATRKSGAETTLPSQDGTPLTRVKTWKWWRPIFIIMVSGVTVADQLVASWLVLDYMIAGVCGVCTGLHAPIQQQHICYFFVVTYYS